jgi:hypothetical protein
MYPGLVHDSKGKKMLDMHQQEAQKEGEFQETME